jgi:hypothetical protein
MPIRPEAEQRLRAGFQRRVDRQASRYVARLTHAERLAVGLECGELVGVFNGRAGGDMKRGAIVIALLPMAAIPVTIAGAAVGIPGMVPLLGATPIITGVWFSLTMWRWREPRRRVWFYAFTQGCVLLDGPRADVVPLRWSEVTEVGEVWTDVYDVSSEESRPVLTAYRLRWADGQTHEISRSLLNVRDPYANVGLLLRGLMPASVGDIRPRFPTIDEIIAAYAGTPGPH